MFNNPSQGHSTKANKSEDLDLEIEDIIIE